MLHPICRDLVLYTMAHDGYLKNTDKTEWLPGDYACHSNVMLHLHICQQKTEKRNGMNVTFQTAEMATVRMSAALFRFSEVIPCQTIIYYGKCKNCGIMFLAEHYDGDSWEKYLINLKARKT